MAKKGNKKKKTNRKTQNNSKNTQISQSQNNNIPIIEEIQKNPKQLVDDFKEFLKQYSIIGLALGIVIGNLTQNTVKSLVEGLITPSINVILKLIFTNLGEISNWQVVIMEDIKFQLGIIVHAFLEFIIVLFIIFLVFKKILNKPELIEKKK